MMMTATPCSASRLTRLSTCSVCATPRAAVGSSRITTRAFFSTARAIATVWRWPPESDETFWRTDFTVRTESERSVSDASFSMRPSSKVPHLVSSRPRNMFCTMSRLSLSARSW